MNVGNIPSHECTAASTLYIVFAYISAILRTVVVSAAALYLGIVSE